MSAGGAKDREGADPRLMMAPEPRGEVWIWLARDTDGTLTRAVPEVLYEGSALARRLGAGLVAVTDRMPDDGERTMLASWRVLRLRMLEHTQPPHPEIRSGRSPFRPLLDGVTPHAVLFPADAFGMVSAPLLAAELGGEYLSGIQGITTDLRGKGRGVVAMRPVLGGQAEALIRCGIPGEPGVLHHDERPVVATLLPGSVGEPVSPRTSTQGDLGAVIEVVPVNEESTDSGQKLQPAVSLTPPDPATVDLEDAERIVAFGRGAFTPEGRALAERLAKTLGAVLAGTRPAADEGWLPFSRQVGLTGAIVRPKLYVALGISGAPYHMVGIKDPETLIAINIDSEAPILAQAHLGLVGDLFTIVPALLDRLVKGDSLENMAHETRMEKSP